MAMNAADIDQIQHTIIAALRTYQQNGYGDPDKRPDDIHDLATNGGNQISMDNEGIDELCQLLNFGDLKIVEASEEFDLEPAPDTVNSGTISNLTDGQRTAIFIDPINRTVESVPYTGSLDEFQALTGGNTISAAPVINAFPGGRLDEGGYWIEGDCPIKGYQFEDSIVNNEEAMMQDDCSFFRFPLHPDPVAGPTLIVGVDDEGKSTAPGLTADDLRPMVEFMGMDISGSSRRR